jgi:hypothetical protein
VVVRNAPVGAVPSDEGFWVGTRGEQRIWVQLAAGGESSSHVRPGRRVSFEGRVVEHTPRWARQLGRDEPGADLLQRQHQHIVTNGPLEVR